jgi:hypothetical protein
MRAWRPAVGDFRPHFANGIAPCNEALSVNERWTD